MTLPSLLLPRPLFKKSVPVHPLELTATKPDEKLKEITDKLEQGIQDLFESDRFKNYLNVMSKFHNYSFSKRQLCNGLILILKQGF